jgi:hypothetical protein
MPCLFRAVLRAVPLLALVLLVGCAEPPSKEMNQAQGAIDAARAAGAERYAADELKAAADSLAQSTKAAADRDYRLALNFALDSLERAQNAARQAVDAKAKARGDAERVIGEVAALVARARTRLADPEIARLPARIKSGPTAAIDRAEGSVQEARAALGQEAYDTVTAALKGQAAAVEAALQQIDAAAGSAAPRPRR